MYTDAALQRTRDLVLNDLENGQAGTGTTTPTTADTDLETPVAATENALTSTSSGQGFQSTLVVLSTQGNGSTLTEYADFFNSGSTMLSRVVMAGIAKTADKEITKITNYSYNRG